MTKEITKSIVLQEMQDKLKLREFESAKFLFDETVTPIYNIGPHFQNWEITHERISITGNGVRYPLIIPPTENHKLRRMSFIHEIGATFDVDQIFHLDMDDATSLDYFFYDTAAPITSGTVRIFEFAQDIPLLSKERIAVNISNFVSGGYISLHILEEIETIR